MMTAAMNNAVNASQGANRRAAETAGRRSVKQGSTPTSVVMAAKLSGGR